MSTGKLSHLQINVDAANLPFYKDLFAFLAWDPIYSDDIDRVVQQPGRRLALVHWRGERCAERLRRRRA